MLAPTILITTRKLRSYFQRHGVMVKINYPIFQILKKPDLEGRMVSWFIEISKYEIQFLPRGNINSQVLADLVVEFNYLVEVEVPQIWTFSMDGASNLKGSGPRYF